MKRLIILLIAFALLITACKTDGGDGGGGSDGSGGTKLTIRNQSFTEVTDVIWNNVSFANNQFENSIKYGTAVTNDVQGGAAYVFFKRKSNPITARTKDMVIVEANENEEFVFTDNTLIVEANNPNNTGTLGSLESTVVWFDDCEGEMQQYFLRQAVSEYYSSSVSNSDSNAIYPPKNGDKSFCIGSNDNALLQLRITLSRKAKLSFWVSNQNTKAIFLINDVEKESWTGHVNWSFRTFDLEPGENDLIWKKVTGKSGYPYYYYYLALDDILIYYTE